MAVCRASCFLKGSSLALEFMVFVKSVVRRTGHHMQSSSLSAKLAATCKVAWSLKSLILLTELIRFAELIAVCGAYCLQRHSLLAKFFTGFRASYCL